MFNLLEINYILKCIRKYHICLLKLFCLVTDKLEVVCLPFETLGASLGIKLVVEEWSHFHTIVNGRPSSQEAILKLNGYFCGHCMHACYAQAVHVYTCMQRPQAM